MTFSLRNLSVLVYAQGFTLWHYRHFAGTVAQASARGFFDGAADMIAGGDMILISAADGGSVAFVSQASAEAGVSITGLPDGMAPQRAAA